MLVIEELYHTYVSTDSEQTLPALANINLTVASGEFLCLIGPSGSGKSTLLNIVAGFIVPTQGTIKLNKHLVNQPSPERGVVFQDHNLFPWLTVLENVAFGLHCQGTSRQRAYRIAQEMMTLVGLADFASFRPHQLSGGMKQRVALARVLALDPVVLLMDEPFSAVDPQTRRKLQNQLLAIWGLNRKTIIFVTHNVDEAIYLADRVVVFHPQPGQIKAEIQVTLPRPRQSASLDFQYLKADLLQLMEQNTLPDLPNLTCHH